MALAPDSPNLLAMIVRADTLRGDGVLVARTVAGAEYRRLANGNITVVRGADLGPVPANVRQALDSWVERRNGPYYGAPGHTTNLLVIDDHIQALAHSLGIGAEGVDYQLDSAQRAVVQENIDRLTKILNPDQPPI